MTLSAQRQAELIDLIDKVCDATIAPDETARLEEALLHDREAQWLYLRRLHLHGNLLWHCESHSEWATLRQLREQAAADWPTAVGAGRLLTVPTPATDPPVINLFSAAAPGAAGSLWSSWALAYLIATLIFGTGLLVGSVVHVSNPAQVARHSSLPSPSGRGAGGEGGNSAVPAPTVVGRITGMVDCRWDKRLEIRDNGSQIATGRPPIPHPSSLILDPSSHPSSLIPHPSSPVSLGDTIALSSGLLEITYDTGAKVILQGPVTYEVESRNGGFLSVGKLTAKLEKRSAVSGQKSEIINHRSESSNPQSLIPNPSLSTLHSPLFTIKTPTAIITDLGTEFGTEVDKRGNTTSYVFHGVIKVKPTAKNGQAVRLNENESAQVEINDNGKSPTVRHVAADPASFVRSGQLVKAAHEAQEQQRLKPFRHWQAYSQKLRHDPSLLAYYNFQLVEGKPSELRNVAGNGDRSLDGVVEIAAWTTGRMLGKHALFFDGANSYVRVDLPWEMTHLTLATWIAIDKSDTDRVSCVLLGSDGWDGPELKCNWQVGRKGEIYFDAKCRYGDFTSPVLPAVDRNAARWRHLAVVADASNRQVTHYLDGKAVHTGAIPKEFIAAFGAARIGNWWSMDGKNERGFHGRMDELMIFGRAMTSQEIEDLYANGKP